MKKAKNLGQRNRLTSRKEFRQCNGRTISIISICVLDYFDKKGGTHSSIIALLPLRILHLIRVALERESLLGHEGVAPGILLLQVGSHKAAKRKTHASRSNKQAMSREVPGRISGAVSERGNGTTQVAETNVHCDSDTTLGRAANVVAVPGNSHGDVRVNTTGGEERAKVLDAGLVGGDQHGESDDRA